MKKIITLENLSSYTSFCHKSYMDLNGRLRFKGMQRFLNETEIRQIAHLRGAIDLLSQMGVDTSSIDLKFDEPDQTSVHDD